MSEKLQIFTRNMEMNTRLEDYVSKKGGKLDKFLGNIDETRVDLTYVKTARSITDRNVAQITVRGKGYILRTEERAEDIFAAFDKALDKMQRQIDRYKGKRYRGRGDGRSAAEVIEPPLEAVAEEMAEEEAPEIARRKKFVLIPMTELEAVEQMRLIGHDNFFVFFNMESNAVNVMYRRRDGSYGLIETEVG
ncbi:MAG: ribosome-associated translation inhibitor RaiA [Chloroflexota bacterium]